MVAIVVGNPRPQSRTLHAASMVARALSGSEPNLIADLSVLGPGLLEWGDPAVIAMRDAVASQDLVVFASPTFKATFTGLLKLFLEQFAGGTGLAGVVGVPLMLGAAPAHALAPELHLRPILTELGATCALPGLYLLEASYAENAEIAEYAERWGPVVAALTAPLSPADDGGAG